MTYRSGLFFGAVMIAIGLAKAWVHMSAQSHLFISTCLGREIALPIDTPIWARAHCWGCYLALFGAVWIGGLVFQRQRLKAAVLAAR